MGQWKLLIPWAWPADGLNWQDLHNRPLETATYEIIYKLWALLFQRWMLFLSFFHINSHWKALLPGPNRFGPLGA